MNANASDCIQPAIDTGKFKFKMISFIYLINEYYILYFDIWMKFWIS